MEIYTGGATKRKGGALDREGPLSPSTPTEGESERASERWKRTNNKLEPGVGEGVGEAWLSPIAGAEAIHLVLYFLLPPDLGGY